MNTSLKTFYVKMYLRGLRARRNARKSGKADEYREFLRDSDMVDAAAAQVLESYYGQCGYGGTITDLLEWLLDHWEEILEIVMVIIDLFTKQQIEPEGGEGEFVPDAGFDGGSSG